ncbi:MAG: S-adenosylmethionine:tRNA ribosyltransferase-isomerase [Cyclobacteriaceae bacterium]
MNTNEYTYQLPEEKIAIYPLPQRDRSKLLIYKEKQISHSTFISLPDHLPGNAFLFFNNTKVIPARLHFKKQSGSVIEIFLLNPVLPSVLLAETMGTTGNCTWQCTIGNLKKWPEGVILTKKINDLTLSASLIKRKEGLIEFSWNGERSFAAVIQDSGETPLPPYIKRKAEASDRERYQTIYSRLAGAVAAPTAGLHFTPQVFNKLDEKKIGRDFLTLHVSAGTFQPIKTQDADDHVMHEEQIIINRTNVQNLLKPGRSITAVGTTSMRTLESIYWFGAKLLLDADSEFRIGQRDPYSHPNQPDASEAIKAVTAYMDRHQLDSIVGETSIYIKPGYDFKVCKALITNFHQPSSTLILLVAAFVGEDWKKIYEEALNHDYRFLSYGDSSLLIP